MYQYNFLGINVTADSIDDLKQFVSEIQTDESTSNAVRDFIFSVETDYQAYYGLDQDDWDILDYNDPRRANKKPTDDPNNMIAKFMGHPVLIWNDPEPVVGNDYRVNTIHIEDDSDVAFITYNGGASEAEVLVKELQLIELQYHTDWNHLMPVVHKCLNICHEHMLNEWEASFLDKLFTCAITSMYNEVVEFVQWYNSHANVFKLQKKLEL